MKFSMRLHLSLLSLLFLTFLHVSAQPPGAAGSLDVRADHLDFDATRNEVTARGNVVLSKGLRSLRADRVTYNTVTEQVRATGNVVFVNDGQIWEGEVLNYNFITGQGDFPGLIWQYDPFRMKADNAIRLSPIHMRMENITLTTCDTLKNPEFMIRASSVDVFEDRVFLLRHARFHLRGVPFFYLPRMALDQDRDATNIDMMPGYSSREGVFLLTTYNRYPADGYITRTHLDLRSERGVALGQDWLWYNVERPADRTEIRTYYANDQKPYRNDREEERLNAQGIELDEHRYRLQLNHRNNFTPDDSLRVRINYLSDPRIVQDFFREEFRREPIPETRATFTSLGTGWSANLDLSRQLNDDDFGGVNRLPEASFVMPSRQLWGSDFLLESDVRAGYLERTFTRFERDNRDRENYESLRVHTQNTVYYPTNFLGWLNVTPRAGFAYTHYGETLRDETRITPESVTDPETGIITTTLQTNTVRRAGGADGRFLPEIGMETSFKAFGILHNDVTAVGHGLRHVAEPFANYTFIPEPDLTPDRIYQFDSIDRLNERHDIRFGVRNKFQTRRRLANDNVRIHDLLNVGLSTRYDLRSDVERRLRNLVLDTELTMVDWMTLRFDAEFNTDSSEFEEFNTELLLIDPASESQLSLNQRYVVDRRHTLQLRYDLFPNNRVGLTGYTRFELEDDGFEEQELLLRYETDCVGYGLGVRWTLGDKDAEGKAAEDDYRVWVQFWLTAFPRGILNIGDR